LINIATEIFLEYKI